MLTTAKGKHLIEAGLQFERFWPIAVMSRSMAACRQTRCWRCSWEFYIQICRQQERDIGSGLDFWNLKAHPKDTPPSTRPHLLVLSNNATPQWLNIPIHESMGAIQTNTLTSWSLKVPVYFSAFWGWWKYWLKWWEYEGPWLSLYLLSWKLWGWALKNRSEILITKLILRF